MHSWKDTLDYSNNTMESAIQYEKFMNVSQFSISSPIFVLPCMFQGIELQGYVGHIPRFGLLSEFIRWDGTVLPSNSQVL